jgi:hypothetical protein
MANDAIKTRKQLRVNGVRISNRLYPTPPCQKAVATLRKLEELSLNRAFQSGVRRLVRRRNFDVLLGDEFQDAIAELVAADKPVERVLCKVKEFGWLLRDLRAERRLADKLAALQNLAAQAADLARHPRPRKPPQVMVRTRGGRRLKVYMAEGWFFVAKLTRSLAVIVDDSASVTRRLLFEDHSFVEHPYCFVDVLINGKPAGEEEAFKALVAYEAKALPTSKPISDETFRIALLTTRIRRLKEGHTLSKTADNGVTFTITCTAESYKIDTSVGATFEFAHALGTTPELTESMRPLVKMLTGDTEFKLNEGEVGCFLYGFKGKLTVNGIEKIIHQKPALQHLLAKCLMHNTRVSIQTMIEA